MTRNKGKHKYRPPVTSDPELWEQCRREYFHGMNSQLLTKLSPQNSTIAPDVPSESATPKPFPSCLHLQRGKTECVVRGFFERDMRVSWDTFHSTKPAPDMLPRSSEDYQCQAERYTRVANEMWGAVKKSMTPLDPAWQALEHAAILEPFVPLTVLPRLKFPT